MIKNIIFDIGGVLVDFAPDRVLRKMGASEEEVQVILDHSVRTDLWKEIDRGAIPYQQVFDQMLKNIPEAYKPNAKRLFDGEILKAVTPFEYSAPWLKSLKEQGYKVFLLTNYPEWQFDFHWKNVFTFTPYVDGKVVSGKVKLIKPDAEIYQALLNKYNLKAEECLFMDDVQKNVQAAQKVGLNAFQFTSYDDARNLIRKVDRDELLEKLVRNYIGLDE